MASKISDIFSKASAKSRVFIIVGTVVGIVGMVIIASKFLGGGTKLAGSAHVAGAPSLQSVPGGQLTPEYYRALMQANAQTAQQAQVSGASAVPTLVNAPASAPAEQSSGDCGVVCPGADSADVATDISALVKSGKLAQADANQLLAMAKNNVPVSEYSDYLTSLVKQGKLTPEEARKLLATYTKQHANNEVSESARTMDALIQSGKLPLDVASSLLELQKKHPTAAEYADELNRLVSEGKISPETAATLLAQYTQQQTRKASAEGAAMLRQMASSGQISQEVAANLENLQKRNVPLSEYQAELDKLVSEGKMTPETAAKLLAQYQAQRLNTGPSATLAGIVTDAEAQSDESVDDLVGAGKISQAAADQISALQKQNLSPQDYAAAIDTMVKSGKIPPDVAAGLKENAVMFSGLAASGKISQATANALQALDGQHLSPQAYADAIDQLAREGKIPPDVAARLKDRYAATQASQDINSLVRSGELSKENAALLKDMQHSQVSPEQYNATIDRMVREGKLSPAAAARLKANYAHLAGLRSVAATLTRLQANNASVAQYADELKRAVANHLLSPEQAAALLKEYQAMNAAVITPPTTPTGGNAPAIDTAIGGGQNFAVLQQRLSNRPAIVIGNNGAPVGPDQAAQFAAAEAAAEAEAAKERQQHVQDLVSQMTAQAQSLISAWSPPVMQYKSGTPDTKGSNGKGGTTTTTTTSSGKNGATSGGGVPEGPPLIKSGTILFAVLTTAVDSDYPDTPVMATIVSGQFKGAALLGKLSLANGQNKVSLNFTIMNEDSWPKSKTISAFAIDPDTARTVLASSVDNHYLLRYGTMFASSFVTGYANGISQSGSTSTSGIFGTSSTHPQLSPGEKIAVALGQVGTTFGTALANYVNTPVTVKVNSGVGLGILFMADVENK